MYVRTLNLLTDIESTYLHWIYISTLYLHIYIVSTYLNFIYLSTLYLPTYIVPTYLHMLFKISSIQFDIVNTFNELSRRNSVVLH